MSHLSILIILICVYTLIGLPCVLMLDPNDRSEGAWRLLAFFLFPLILLFTVGMRLGQWVNDVFRREA